MREIFRSVEELRLAGLTLPEAELYRVLVKAADDSGAVSGPGVETLATRAGIARRTAYRHIKSLEAKRCLEVVRDTVKRGGRSKVNRYRILPVAGIPSRTLTAAVISPSLAKPVNAYSERSLSLARQVAEASNYRLELIPKDLEAVDVWLEAGASEELVLRVVRDDRAKASPKRVYALNFYTRSIKQELLRVAAATQQDGRPPPALQAAVIAPAAVAQPAVPPIDPAQSGPSGQATAELAAAAMAWAKIVGRPKPKERAVVKDWLCAGATPDLIKTVIQTVLDRGVQPLSLLYFDGAIRDELADAQPAHDKTIETIPPSIAAAMMETGTDYGTAENFWRLHRHVKFRSNWTSADWKGALQTWLLRRAVQPMLWRPSTDLAEEIRKAGRNPDQLGAAFYDLHLLSGRGAAWDAAAWDTHFRTWLFGPPAVQPVVSPASRTVPGQPPRPSGSSRQTVSG